MNQGRRPPSATRDALLAAAVRLIRAAADPAEVTVRKIIRAARANLNAVNYHFGAKEDLVREAVRAIIGGWFRARGLPARGVQDEGPLALALLASGFLFAEPVASRLALDAEVAAGGAGQSLTRETLEGLAREIGRAQPGLGEGDVRLRAWALLSSVHLLFLRPAGCREWLGADPADEASRAALLARLLALFGPAR